MSEFDIIVDHSHQNLREVPWRVIEMPNLRMLYLQQNLIQALPKNFFQKLPHLVWLDLRNNQLASIPQDIAYHQNLENLLLSDNKLEVLPNEMGLLPKLKVLQVANNPLVYPNSKVVAEGTKSILAYLKQQCEKLANGKNIKQEPPRRLHPVDNKVKEERVIGDYVNENFTTESGNSAGLIVRGHSSVKRRDSGIIHKMTTSTNKILLKSYYEDEDNLSPASTQTGESLTYMPTYKQTWMTKLKQLLDQQEKILQQEKLNGVKNLMNVLKRGVSRNLQALNSWRTVKKTEPMRQESYQAQPPYATDPRFNSILSREDMHKEIDKLVQHRKKPPKTEEIEKLISELVGQLKDMETSYGGLQSPRTEIEAAGSQITKIMEMHKKILELRETNDLLLQ